MDHIHPPHIHTIMHPCHLCTLLQTLPGSPGRHRHQRTGTCSQAFQFQTSQSRRQMKHQRPVQLHYPGYLTIGTIIGLPRPLQKDLRQPRLGHSLRQLHEHIISSSRYNRPRSSHRLSHQTRARQCHPILVRLTSTAIDQFLKSSAHRHRR